jgi:hypothetical protein
MVTNRIDHIEVAKSLNASEIDLLLILVGLNLMKSFGHRYGSFIEAISSAAKFVVYLTYLEQDQNLRRTGFIHHIEPKRVKAIVQEFEQVIQSGNPFRLLGSAEPHYLIGVPYLWQQKFPKCQKDQSRFKNFCLSTSEKFLVESRFPKTFPDCLAITECQLKELILILHDESQEFLPHSKKINFSEALAEHAKFRLIDSGTIQEIKLDKHNVAYVLAKNEYSPKGEQARKQTMVQDLSRYFRFLSLWVDEDPHVMRGIETLNIDPDKREEAVSELDMMIRKWADKHHTEEGTYALALQFLAGPYEAS